MMFGKQFITFLLFIVFVFAQRSRACAADRVTDPSIGQIRIGFTNHYKLGFWIPIVVEVEGSSTIEGLRIDVTAADSDGVATTATQLISTQASPDGKRSATVYMPVGRVGEPIRIVLTGDDRVLDERILQPTPQSKAKEGSETKTCYVPLAATSEVLVSLGTADFGLKSAFPDRDENAGPLQRKLIALTSESQLPDEWYGYESVDVLFLSGSDRELLRHLANDTSKRAALERWITNGGRLVIFCGGDDVREVLAQGGLLASLIPGKLSDVVRLPDTSILERFASSSTPVANAAIIVPQLTEVTGNIEMYSGRRAADLPLVVRTPRGFGEVAFVGVDFSRPPLDTWPGRNAFLHALLRPYLSDSVAAETSTRLATSGFNDLSGALRQQLGRSFSSVQAVGFPVVAALALAYLAVLGPIDYLFVHRWLRRPLAAWITFPAIVIAFSLVSVAVANRFRGGSSTQINRINLIDVDASGGVRGTTWAVLYSPHARRFSPQLELPSSGDLTGDATTLFSWWGLPGSGIGGMQSGGSDLGIFQDGYRFGEKKDSLDGVPVLSSATKALMGRWAGMANSKIVAELTDVDGLATGTITNETGGELRNTRLLYGSWAYRLGNLRSGQRVDLGDEQSPRSAKTIVTRDALGESGATAAKVEGRVFAAERATALEILSLMMFYKTAGGDDFAHVSNRYQSYCDMSRQLALGRAVLVGESPTAGSSIVDQATGQSLVDNIGENTDLTVYRYVLPVERAAAQ
jgi:hypothetical protein